MSTIQVQGLRSLKGEVKIQGSKNAVLPMMAAAILHKGTTILSNVPRIQDVFCMMGILQSLGCRLEWIGDELCIDASEIVSVRIPEEYVRGMRSSIMLLGALLGRTGEAVTCYPGGCSIGKRPITLHLEGLRAMGAVIEEFGEEICAAAPHLTGTEVHFSFPSVGATENVLMAAVLAEGVTTIHGAAREPEIEELCLFLNRMGAKIYGIGTSTLSISGTEELCDSCYSVAGDRVVAGTYLASVLAAGGSATLFDVNPNHMRAALRQTAACGACLNVGMDWISVEMCGRPLAADLVTGPYPDFPTDLQSPFLAVMSVACGSCIIEENVFEARFETVKELRKMGSDIIIDKNKLCVTGCFPLLGTSVAATDLRGGAALVIAGLAAEGSTTIGNCSHILRGYEDICRDLGQLGAVVYCCREISEG